MKQVALLLCLCAVPLFSTASFAAGSTEPVTARSDGFRYYPAYRRKPRHNPVEVVHDRGLIVEMIIGCDGGAGILTYSKVERVFCLPNHTCTGRLNIAIDRLCGW